MKDDFVIAICIVIVLGLLGVFLPYLV